MGSTRHQHQHRQLASNVTALEAAVSASSCVQATTLTSDCGTTASLSEVCSSPSALPLRRVTGSIPVDCLIKCQLSFQAICLHKSLFPRLISLFSQLFGGC